MDIIFILIWTARIEKIKSSDFGGRGKQLIVKTKSIIINQLMLLPSISIIIL